MYKVISYFPLFFFLSLHLSSQNGQIKGQLKTSDLKPAAYISVGLMDLLYGTQSNESGQFELKNIPAGSYTLVISQLGIETKKLNIEVIEGKTTLVENIVLTESALQLNEVIVYAGQNLNEKSIYAGKINLQAMDLPQSISVIEKNVLEQQQTQTMSDALKNFNGVYLMGTTGGVQQEIAARGFAFSSSNTFKNGVRFNNAVMPEMSALERVEVMKGSAAILFGNVAAGGIINLVTKKPTFTNGGEINMRFDSYNFYKPSIDIYGLLDEKKKVAFRINSIYENAKSFRDNVSSDRVYFNPSLAIKLGRKTQLLIEGDYLRDNRTSDFGVGAIDYALIQIPRNQFLGAKWSYYNTHQKSVTASISHRFNSNWQLKSVSSAQSFSNDLFGSQRPNSSNQFIKANGNWIRGIQRTQVEEDYYLTQLDLTGRFSTGFIKHHLLIGADADRYNTITLAYNPLSRYDSINIFDLSIYKQRNDIPDLTKRISTKTPVLRSGAYIQDLLEVTNRLKLLVGVRASYLETGSIVLTYSTSTLVKTKQYDFATTPRLGLVFQPTKKLSLFGSYANSFTPNTGVDINNKPLKPSFITQYETGLKSNIFKEIISANVTVYQIKNSNLAQTSLQNGNINSNIKELAGEVTSQGLEVDIMSKSIKGFMIIAGYSYNVTKYTKSNTYIEGSLLRYNPNHTANLSAYYTVNTGSLKGFNAGTSLLYFGERKAGRSTRITVANDPYKLFTLPAYTMVDFTVGYTLKSMTFRLKISNLTNALSYNVHDDNSVNPIAPRQFAISIGYRF